MADSTKKRIRAYQADGWKATMRPGGHIMLTHPDAAFPVWTSASPGALNVERMTRAMMKRALTAKRIKFYGTL